MFKVPKYDRIQSGPLASDASYGNNGAFQIAHYKIKDYSFFCIVSDGEGWEHVSVSLRKEKQKIVERCPTWEEMCFVKSLFWDEEDPVMQLHPPKSQWINNHPYCLHLWKPTSGTIPLPDELLVGHKLLNL